MVGYASSTAYYLSFPLKLSFRLHLDFNSMRNDYEIFLQRHKDQLSPETIEELNKRIDLCERRRRT